MIIFVNAKTLTIMKNLCKYALIAAIVLLVLFLLRILAITGAVKLSAVLSYSISILACVLFLVFFCWLLSITSSSKSPVAKPALLCTIGYAAMTVAYILDAYIFGTMLKDVPNSIGTWYAVERSIETVGALLVAGGLGWMAKYFTKGSSQQIATYTLAAALILIVCLSLASTHFINSASDPARVAKIYSITVVSLNFIAQIFFMFEFSKLKK